MKWIPAWKQMPPMGDLVLCRTKHGDPHVGAWIGWFRRDQNDHWHHLWKEALSHGVEQWGAALSVTHWAPLPEDEE